MNGLDRNDVLRMAREAGFDFNSLGVTFTSGYLDDHLKRFAHLVAAAEREACAKVCDAYDVAEDVNSSDTAEGIAIAIRARGQG